jgi:hypothetical protein
MTAAAAAAAVRPPGVSSGRRAGGGTASGPPTQTAPRMGICTAASTVMAGISGAGVVVMAAAATSITAKIAAGTAAAAAVAADGAGSAVDSRVFSIALLFFLLVPVPMPIDILILIKSSHIVILFPNIFRQASNLIIPVHKEAQTIKLYVNSIFFLHYEISPVLLYLFILLAHQWGQLLFDHHSVSHINIKKCGSDSQNVRMLRQLRSTNPIVIVFNVFFLLMLSVVIFLSFLTLSIVIKKCRSDL